jgi:hypothetical protein
MKTSNEILAKELIRYHRGMAGGKSNKLVYDLEVQEAFGDAIHSKILRLLAEKKEKMREDFGSFLGAVGTAVGHGVASEIGTALGVKGSTITTLARTAFSKSKPKSTTKTAASKKPTAKKKKLQSKSAIGSSPQKPMRISADQYRKEAGLPPRGSKNENTFSVVDIRTFRKENGKKVAKMHEQKPNDKGK